MSKFALVSVLLLCSGKTGSLGDDEGFEWPSPKHPVNPEHKSKTETSANLDI
jgi:hypothetical protein